MLCGVANRVERLALWSPFLPGCDSGSARQFEEPEYQVPSPPPSSTTPPVTAITAITAPNASATATDSSRVYEVLDDVAEASKKDHRRSFDNPAYYSTLQDVHSTTDRHNGPVLVRVDLLFNV